MPEEIGLFEAMHTQRAIRYFKPDPVPDELINKILEAAVRAPSGANLQRWAFIVIKDPETRRKIADCYRSAGGPISTADMPSQQQRIYTAAAHLAEHLHEVPVFILACVRTDDNLGALNRAASIFPAVQNILLAARGLGLGSVLTTRHRREEEEVKRLLGIPEDVETAALLPIGYPAEGVSYGPTSRRSMDDVVFYDKWGST